MSRLIRDISRDIKCKIHNADKDIRKAIERKDLYSDLSEKYYRFSDEQLQDVMILHNEIVKLIDDYRDKNGEPSSIMMTLYEEEHKNLIEDIAEIKLLQDFYKNL